MSHLSLTCEEISPMLDAFHDGELDQSEHAGVTLHLSLCGKCQAKLSEIGNVVSSLKSLPRMQMPRDLTLDAEFMRRAMAVANATSSATTSEGSTDTKEKVGGELKSFPVRAKAGSAPLMKKIFPLPGPVIFASVAAAAALALVVIVPRYLNAPANNSPSLASLPKTNNEKLSESNHSQNIAAVGHTSEIRAAHNATNQPVTDQESASHLPVRAIAQGAEMNVSTNKEPRDVGGHATSELASAKVPSVSQPTPQAVEQPAESTGTQDSQISSHSDQVLDERDAQQNTAPEQGELIALYPGDGASAVNDELAIPTDEDGLYALKL
jgi:anti-sigma factor RsiW